jgi:hypothetical protein
MRRFNAFVAMGAMLCALTSAPFFHKHDRDHEGNSLVHAHVIEAESPLTHSDDAIDHHDTHEKVRWVDVFTSTAPLKAFCYIVAEPAIADLLPSPPVNRVAMAVAVLHEHSPPDRSAAVPRSPPAI